MKQTIEFSGNKKAVVEIPYSKLTGQSTAYQYQQGNQGDPCCDSKVVLVGCGGCSGKGRQRNSQQLKLLVELEQAYDKDVKELEGRIKSLEAQKNQCKTNCANELAKLNKEFSFKLEQRNETVDLLRRECKKKDCQIAELIKERDIIVKNKISQFRQNEYIQKINDLQGLLRLKDIELKEFVSKFQVIQIDKIRVEEGNKAQQLKWQNQLARFNRELKELEMQYTKQKITLTSALKLKEDEHRKDVQTYQKKLETGYLQFKEVAAQNERLRQANSKKNKSAQQLTNKMQKLQTQLAIVTDTCNKQKQENALLFQKIVRGQENLLFIDKQKGQLLIQLQEKLITIDKLREQLKNKEKVYEVKIERVVDGQSQIDQMQAVIMQLQLQLKQLNGDKQILGEEVKKRQFSIEELRGTIAKLQAQISGLKAYIQKREGSFKWAVERQIQKDIQVSEIKPQIYKVSQIKQYSRDINKDFSNVAEQIAFNIQTQMSGNYVQNLDLNQYK